MIFQVFLSAIEPQLRAKRPAYLRDREKHPTRELYASTRDLRDIAQPEKATIHTQIDRAKAPIGPITCGRLNARPINPPLATPMLGNQYSLKSGMTKMTQRLSDQGTEWTVLVWGGRLSAVRRPSIKEISQGRCAQNLGDLGANPRCDSFPCNFANLNRSYSMPFPLSR